MNFPSSSTLAEFTQKQREDFALKLFAFDRVADMIRNAATEGKGYIRITQTLSESEDSAALTIAASLNKTKACKQLVTKLKKAGYTVEWVGAAERERSNKIETGAFIIYDEMRITWRPTKIISGPEVMPAD